MAKVTGDTRARFIKCFETLCKCDMGKTAHPNTAFLFYELNVEHRFMAAVLDSLAKTLREHGMALTPENMDAYLPPAVAACAEAAKQAAYMRDMGELPRGLQSLLANPHAFRSKSAATWALLRGVEQRLNMRADEGWRLIVDRKKIALLSERGIEENWPLMHLFDAEADFAVDLARGWKVMLADLDSGQRFSMDMARRWHASCTGRDGSTPSAFAEDTSCPVVEDISMTKAGRRELEERLRLLRDDYSVPCRVFVDDETKQKTAAMGREFIYVNRDDTSMEMLERFAQRKADDYMSITDKIAGRRMDAQTKSDKLLMADIEFIQYSENAHMFADGNGRVWAVLFPNYSALKRGESPILPFEPYVIDSCSAAEVFHAYRSGQDAFQALVKSDAPDPGRPPSANPPTAE